MQSVQGAFFDARIVSYRVLFAFHSLSLDEFSKALAGEVRALLGEVGNLREVRRALY